MKFFILTSAIFFSLSSFASLTPMTIPKPNPWALGVGFGTESDYDSVTLLELKSPSLISILRGTNDLSLVLTIETKEITGIDKDIIPIHLLVEMSGPAYKDLVRSYVRLGGGAVLIDDTTIYPASSFFNVQFQLGLDVITGMTPSGMGSSFFVQAMVNSPAIRNPPLGYVEIYDGTTLLVGFRMYF